MFCDPCSYMRRFADWLCCKSSTDVERVETDAAEKMKQEESSENTLSSSEKIQANKVEQVTKTPFSSPNLPARAAANVPHVPRTGSQEDWEALEKATEERTLSQYNVLQISRVGSFDPSQEGENNHLQALRLQQLMSNNSQAPQPSPRLRRLDPINHNPHAPSFHLSSFNIHNVSITVNNYHTKA